MRYVGTLQGVELDDGTHDDGGGQKMDQVLQFGKRRKRKQKWAQGKGIIDRVIFVLPIKTP
jgi:hypothetical protein